MDSKNFFIDFSCFYMDNTEWLFLSSSVKSYIACLQKKICLYSSTDGVSMSVCFDWNGSKNFYIK